MLIKLRTFKIYRSKIFFPRHTGTLTAPTPYITARPPSMCHLVSTVNQNFPQSHNREWVILHIADSRPVLIRTTFLLCNQHPEGWISTRHIHAIPHRYFSDSGSDLRRATGSTSVHTSKLTLLSSHLFDSVS